jgi:5-methylcytosine-specific restriction endonuclease McrA
VFYEYIDHVAIFERDGWRCQICGKPTPARWRGTHRSNAPELDHRVPITKRGAHAYGNVQCACRACNGWKSNRLCVGQLPLFDVGA